MLNYHNVTLVDFGHYFKDVNIVKKYKYIMYIVS